MKKIALLVTLMLMVSTGYSQSAENAELIKLGKAYKDNMFRNTPDKKYLSNDKKITSRFLYTFE